MFNTHYKRKVNPKICVGRDTVVQSINLSFFVFAHALFTTYLTETFLLASFKVNIQCVCARLRPKKRI